MTTTNDPDPCTYCPRCIDAGALGALADVVECISPAGLHTVLTMLRAPGRWSGATPAQNVAVASLRDRVARRMVNELGADPDYLTGTGDLMPSPVPDHPGDLADGA